MSSGQVKSPHRPAPDRLGCETPLVPLDRQNTTATVPLTLTHGDSVSFHLPTHRLGSAAPVSDRSDQTNSLVDNQQYSTSQQRRARSASAYKTRAQHVVCSVPLPLLRPAPPQHPPAFEASHRFDTSFVRRRRALTKRYTYRLLVPSLPPLHLYSLNTRHPRTVPRTTYQSSTPQPPKPSSPAQTFCTVTGPLSLAPFFEQGLPDKGHAPYARPTPLTSSRLHRDTVGLCPTLRHIPKLSITKLRSGRAWHSLHTGDSTQREVYSVPQHAILITNTVDSLSIFTLSPPVAAGMFETTVGQLSTREIGTVPSPSHFLRGTSPRTSAEALGRPFGEYGGGGDKEDLTSEPDLVDDEVGDLSGESS